MCKFALKMERIFISVILPLRLEWTPCYYISSALVDDVLAGVRVRVCFAGRIYIGVVDSVGIKPEVDEKKVLPVLSVESALDRISPEEISLWKFVAGYYLCTIGEVYKAAYPALKTGGEISRMRSAEKAEERRVRDIDRKIASLSAKRESITVRIERKHVQIEKARKDSSKSKYLSEIELLEAESIEIGKKISMLAVCRNVVPTTASSYENETIVVHQDFTLSIAQSVAVEGIRKCFSERKPVLLHGITGSGKTEIYITLAIEALSRGKNVLYLIPEIAVSRQLEERLMRIFGSMLFSFHSRETVAKRLDVASAVRCGRYVVIGTRSSIFLPHHDLGLVIVDEEHDTSYKQDAPAPRYNGRDTALMLAKIYGADIVLGTATPSLESLYNCRTGLFGKVDLFERYYGTQDSDVEIIDTIAERRKHGMSGNFSFKLISDIRRTLENKGQILILRGRRSYAPAVQCSGCGEIKKCPHCNVPLSWHKQEGVLLCHYCGWRMPYTGQCEKCGGVLEPIGSGTQKIEEEARNLFPNANIERLDSDTSGREENIIKDFAHKKIDILIGTQIIAKGFDFGNLSLVAVLQADSLLAQHDFRADERAVQLLEQFRGRSGRRGVKGLFVIQTSQPSHPVYSVFKNSESVNKEETDVSEKIMKERFEFGYPPFSRIVRIIVKDSNESRLEKLSGELAMALREGLGIKMTGFIQVGTGAVTVMGPYTPVVDKLSDQYIKHIRVSLKKDSNLVKRKNELAGIVSKFESEKAYMGHVAIDVDPI